MVQLPPEWVSHGFRFKTLSRIEIYKGALNHGFLVYLSPAVSSCAGTAEARCKPVPGRSTISSLKSKASAAPTPDYLSLRFDVIDIVRSNILGTVLANCNNWLNHYDCLRLLPRSMKTLMIRKVRIKLFVYTYHVDNGLTCNNLSLSLLASDLCILLIVLTLPITLLNNDE